MNEHDHEDLSQALYDIQDARVLLADGNHSQACQYVDRAILTLQTVRLRIGQSA